MTSLIDKISQRVRSGRDLIQMDDGAREPPPPVGIDRIAAAEHELGFTLPSALRGI